jgi:hypothetical protein
LRRQSRPGARDKEKLDQWLHRLMGRFMGRKKWKKREAKQWPSGTGSYDPCVDEYNYLLGRGKKEKAKSLREEANRRRDGFSKFF